MNEQKNVEGTKMADSEHEISMASQDNEVTPSGEITSSPGCDCDYNIEGISPEHSLNDDSEVSNSGSIPPETSISRTELSPQSMPSPPPGGITPSQEIQKPALVYALGTLDYDFATEARQDSYQQSMKEGTDPNNPEDLLDYLKGNEYAAAGITWTLNIDETPVYAIHPGCPFANIVYQYIRDFLKEQIDGNVVRVSIPGYIAGKTTLMSGQILPMVIPELRGMFCWDKRNLIADTLGKDPEPKQVQDLDNFLGRIYYEMRNLGQTSRDRALNHAGTDAFIASTILTETRNKSLEMQNISLEQSPLCRPGSDCWDVKLTFFDPTKVIEAAKTTYRYTIDVTDVIPVTIGKIRKWSEF
ncbi:MAG: hypothetical protein GY737_31410 [Desulfobacteraceae bacterium]|nr:hypothetical protein [Desulfobacteraceae bacterium]